jgi:predicted amidohydrolase YtcJ
LEEGKEADFIILDGYIFNIPATQINQTKVNETYLKGGRFFKR